MLAVDSSFLVENALIFRLAHRFSVIKQPLRLRIRFINCMEYMEYGFIKMT